MSEAIAFDTHRFVKRLTASGFTERQAETLADEQITLLNANLATKADIAAVKADVAAVQADVAGVKEDVAGVKADVAEVKADIAGVKADIAKVEAGMDALREKTKADIARIEAGMDALRHETRAAIEIAKTELLKWMFAALIAQGSVVVALIKLV